MPVPRHGRDAEVVKRDTVVARDEPMRQVVQEVRAGIGDPLARTLKAQDGLAPARAARRSAGNAPLQHPRRHPARLWAAGWQRLHTQSRHTMFQRGACCERF